MFRPSWWRRLMRRREVGQLVYPFPLKPDHAVVAHRRREDCEACASGREAVDGITDGKWCLHDHRNVLRTDPSGKVVYMDEGVAWLVEHLWERGVRTWVSCQGGPPTGVAGYIGYAAEDHEKVVAAMPRGLADRVTYDDTVGSARHPTLCVRWEGRLPRPPAGLRIVHIGRWLSGHRSRVKSRRAWRPPRIAVREVARQRWHLDRHWLSRRRR